MERLENKFDTYYMYINIVICKNPKIIKVRNHAVLEAFQVCDEKLLLAGEVFYQVLENADVACMLLMQKVPKTVLRGL